MMGCLGRSNRFCLPISVTLLKERPAIMMRPPMASRMPFSQNPQMMEQPEDDGLLGKVEPVLPSDLGHLTEREASNHDAAPNGIQNAVFAEPANDGTTRR